MKTRSKLWIAISAYIAFIYLTLPVMRDVINALYSYMGRSMLGVSINSVLLVLTSVLILYVAVKRGPLAASIPLITVLFVVFFVKRPEERIHFLEYGLLGVLVYAASGEKIFFSLAFAFIVGCVDETIQWLLPSRVGDIRDVFMNGAGGTLGVWFGKQLKNTRRRRI